MQTYSLLSHAHKEGPHHTGILATSPPGGPNDTVTPDTELPAPNCSLVPLTLSVHHIFLHGGFQAA